MLMNYDWFGFVAKEAKLPFSTVPTLERSCDAWAFSAPDRKQNYSGD